MSAFLYWGHVFLFAFAALASFASLPRARNIQREDTRFGMTALLTATALWASSYVAYLVVASPALQEAAYTVGLMAAFTAVGAWVYFAAAYTGRPPRHAPFRWIGIGVYVGVILTKITNPLHHLYFSVAPASSPFPHLAIQYGILYWLILGLTYILAGIGFFMLLELFHHAGTNTRPLAILVVLTGAPVTVDILAVVQPSLLPMTYEPVGVAVFAVGVLFFYFDRFRATQIAGDVDDPVIFVDTEGRIRDYNRAATDAFPEIAQGMGDSISAVAPQLAEALDAGRDVLELDAEDGTAYYRLSKTPFGSGDTVTSRLLVLTDVTETERQRAELERKTEQLAVLNRVVRHDIRNDMNVVLGWSDRADEHVDDAGEDAIRRIRDTAQHVVQLTTVARDFVETLTAADEPDLEPVDLVDKLTVEIGEIRESYPEVDIDVDVPDRSVTVRANEMLSSVFQNILHNAVQHNDTETPKISVSATTNDRTATVRIADNGPGIPDSRKEAVFGKGEMGIDSSGTGIGLYLVSELVDLYGGTVWIEDDDPRGAVFVVELPMLEGRREVE